MAVLGSWLRRPVIAALLLLVVYVGLSFLNDTHGYLGTDTGGKVATLEAMKRGDTLTPDVGYWAKQWDPEAKYHPLYGTTKFRDDYVNVTTLPMLWLSAPLYDVGGYRLALIVPIAGAIASAFAARALADRLKPGTGWAAYWLIGVASPVTIYALDLWEHSLGLALISWAFVLLADALLQRPVLVRGAAAGALCGLAFTLRTEALVYAFVGVGGACVAVVARDRALRRALGLGSTAVVGFGVMIGLNSLIERVVLGGQLRTERAGSAASSSATIGFRLREGLTTLFSLRPNGDTSTIVLGMTLVVLIAFVALRLIRSELIALACVGLIVAAYLLRMFADGWGFVPGALVAAPVAALGAVAAWRQRASLIPLLVALLVLPVVWRFEFPGGAVPQWGGRYVLPTMLLLVVVGCSCLGAVDRRLAATLVALSVLITGVGVGWLSVRSHDVNEVRVDLEARGDRVLISTLGFFLRELGSAELDHRWLRADVPADLAGAARVAADSGASEIDVLGVDDSSATAPALGGWTLTRTDKYRWLGAEFRIDEYVAS